MTLTLSLAGTVPVKVTRGNLSDALESFADANGGVGILLLAIEKIISNKIEAIKDQEDDQLLAEWLSEHADAVREIGCELQEAEI